MRTLDLHEITMVSAGASQNLGQASKYDLLDIVSTLTGANLVANLSLQILRSMDYAVAGNLVSPFIGAAGFLVGSIVGYQISQFIKSQDI